jgi:hypothetical protein
MGQKTYQFPKTGGGEVMKTLAPPTPKRLAAFLSAFGKKSFTDFTDESAAGSYALQVLESGLTTERLAQLLDICLIEGSVDIDFDNVDLRLTDEAIQDFFEQRARKLRERLSS